MKYQNIILIGAFIFLIVVFYALNIQLGKKKAVVIEQKEEINYYSVELSGEFIRTGTYLIPCDWTVQMLFDYAGVKKSGDISEYVLSDLVEDNKKYYVPQIEVSGEADNLININTATFEELLVLNGIGEVLASNIVEYRQENLFTSTEEIKNVKGIGEYIYEKIKNFITV